MMTKFVLLAASSFGLGALHALEPGHGKTVVAAYLVGNRGRWYHALHLGVVVTITHTIGIILLGLLATYASERYAPEHITYWLRLISAILIVIVGASMIWLRSRDAGQEHHHAHHHHHDKGPDHEHFDRAASNGPISAWTLTALGISGGILPCPAALAVLLAAIGSGQLRSAVLLVVVFSLGMACVLVGIGLIVVRASHFAERLFTGAKWIRYTPIAGSVTVTTLGVTLLLGALLSGSASH